ncbi:MAG: hypothetical protein H7343_24150 [Undibacterium sp.]|nr:hypothetical protein [Opitutaceae bacterium]
MALARRDVGDLKARTQWGRATLLKSKPPTRRRAKRRSLHRRPRLAAKPSDVLKFNASTDPDALRYSWWIYPEAGPRPYGQSLASTSATAPAITSTTPADAVGKELHLNLEISDENPTAPLMAYFRAVVVVNEIDR